MRQESGGYPVRTVCYDPLADRPDFPSPSPTLTSRQMVEPPALRAPALRRPSPTLLTHPRHAHTRQTRRSALKRKEKIVALEPSACLLFVALRGRSKRSFWLNKRARLIEGLYLLRREMGKYFFSPQLCRRLRPSFALVRFAGNERESEDLGRSLRDERCDNGEIGGRRPRVGDG